MAKKCKRTKVKWQGARVVLPCRKNSLTAAMKQQIQGLKKTDVTAAKKDPAKCGIVFFTGKRVGVLCKNRSAAYKAKLKAKRRARAKALQKKHGFFANWWKGKPCIRQTGAKRGTPKPGHRIAKGGKCVKTKASAVKAAAKKAAARQCKHGLLAKPYRDPTTGRMRYCKKAPKKAPKKASAKKAPAKKAPAKKAAAAKAAESRKLCATYRRRFEQRSARGYGPSAARVWKTAANKGCAWAKRIRTLHFGRI